MAPDDTTSKTFERIDDPSDPGVVSPATDLRVTTPEANFGCHGAARSVPGAGAAGVAWAEGSSDIYTQAQALAAGLGISKIVAVGCGDGRRLVSAFPPDAYEVVGVDFPSALTEARRDYPQMRWIACHLGATRQLERVFSGAGGGAPILIILADILERLPDPRPLLRAARGLLLSRPGSRLALSTPDRDRTHGAGYAGLPAVGARMREWRLAELTRYLASSGFTLERAGYIRAHLADAQRSACYVEASCAAEDYERFLARNGLPNANTARCALVTAEHATLGDPGEIGRYAANLIQLGGEGIAPIYVGDAAAADALTASGWLHPRLFFDASFVAAWDPADLAWKMVEHLLFFSHQLHVVEYQDAGGLGARLAQAKEGGLISDTIRTQVMCFGNQTYTDYRRETWRGMSHATAWITDRIAIEKADSVIIPTRALQAFYQDVGYDLADRVIAQRPPYFYADRSPFAEVDLQPVDTLIFFGALAPRAGFERFVQALRLLSDTTWAPESLGIREVVLVAEQDAEQGDASDAPVERIERIERIERALGPRGARLTVSRVSGSHADALRALAARRSHALVVASSLGEGRLYAAPDLIDLGIPFVAVGDGSAPEFIPAEFQPHVLTAPDPQALAESVRDLLRLDPAARQRLFAALREACVAEQERINAASLRYHTGEALAEASPTGETHELRAPGELISVVVPVYNTDLDYIRDLCVGLNGQTIMPREVIFVDDGSPPGYTQDLERALHEALRSPWRVIRQPNRGPAAARNVGLYACATKYLATFDSDDIPAPDFLYLLVQHLERHPALWATSTYLRCFYEARRDDWTVARMDGVWFRPLGETLVFGQLRNVLGLASAGFRVEPLRAIGGWDESDKALWEDWACYLRIVSHGGKLGVIPTLGYLYRVREQSHGRSHPEYPAERRLARNTTALPPWEAYSLQSVMRDYDATPTAPPSPDLPFLVNHVSGRLLWRALAIKLANQLRKRLRLPHKRGAGE